MPATEYPPRPRLLIHIGAGKCGSTAIQQFLLGNHQALGARGYLLPGPTLLPDEAVTGQQVWYFNDCLRDPGQWAPEVQARLRALAGRLPLVGARTLVLSAENLSITPRAVTLFAPLREQFDVRIVFYVRRQDDYLIAFWQQWGFKQHLDFWAWLLDALLPGRPAGHGDWLADISPWVEVFGEAAIRVRRFGRDYFSGGDLLRDFCESAGIEPTGLCFAQPPRNLSFDDDVMDFAYGLRDLFDGPHDTRFFEMVARWGGPAVLRSGASRLLNDAQRAAVLGHFAARNQALKERFLPELSASEPLFAPPVVVDSPAEITRPANWLSGHQAELCLRLLHGAYRDITALQAGLAQRRGVSGEE